MKTPPKKARRKPAKHHAAWAVVLGLGALGIGSAIYELPGAPKSAGHSGHAEHGSHSENQLQAPPRPPRLKPIERVVATSKSIN